MQTIGREAKNEACLLLLKMKYKGNIHTFAIPFRSDSGNAPNCLKGQRQEIIGNMASLYKNVSNY